MKEIFTTLLFYRLKFGCYFHWPLFQTKYLTLNCSRKVFIMKINKIFHFDALSYLSIIQKLMNHKHKSFQKTFSKLYENFQSNRWFIRTVYTMVELLLKTTCVSFYENLIKKENPSPENKIALEMWTKVGRPWGKEPKQKDGC